MIKKHKHILRFFEKFDSDKKEEKTNYVQDNGMLVLDF
jgi:hypothetical protein